MRFSFVVFFKVVHILHVRIVESIMMYMIICATLDLF